MTGLSEETYRDFERTQLRTRDGTMLAVYEFGPLGAPKIAIVNPIGVPILVASRLMRQLGENYRVICWKQRGCDDESPAFFDKPHDYATYLSDLVRVVEAYCSDPCALIAICSGASLAIRAIAQGLIQAAPLVLVSPAVRFNDGYVPSIFDKAVVPYMQLISTGNRTLAKDLLEMRSTALTESARVQSEDEKLMEAADKWSLRSIDSLMVYARTVKVFGEQRMDTDIARVRQKVFIQSAADDQTVEIASVRRLAKLLPDAELTEYSTGGHFMVFLDQRMTVAIRGIVDEFQRCTAVPLTCAEQE